MALPVEGGARLQKNYVGAAFADYDDYVVLSHFKGHAMAGYGGAMKNISIGLGSREGKSWIHSGGTGGSMWSGEQDAFLEAIGDAGKSVSDALGHGARIVYLNVMNRLSVDCDCDGNPAEPEMADIGILASTDRPGGPGPGLHRPGLCRPRPRSPDPADREPQRHPHPGERRGHRPGQPRLPAGTSGRINTPSQGRYQKQICSNRSHGRRPSPSASWRPDAPRTFPPLPPRLSPSRLWRLRRSRPRRWAAAGWKPTWKKAPSPRSRPRFCSGSWTAIIRRWHACRPPRGWTAFSPAMPRRSSLWPG